MQMQITSGYGANNIYAAGLGCKRTRLMMQFAWDNYRLSAHGPAKGIREWCKQDL